MFFITLNLTLNNSSTTTDVQNHCNNYTWIDGITIQDGNANDASDGTQVHRFRGGGYSLSSGTNYIQFSSCHFANNAALSGGALNLRDLDNNYRYINFYNCQFTKNKAGRASLADINGKYLSGLNTFFVNCIIAENEGTNEGNRNASLIYYESNGSTVRTNLYIHGCTITNNLEASKDAFSPAPLIGVNKPDFAHQMNLEIVNTIVYNNEAPSTYKKLNTWDPKATRIHNCILESTDLPLNDLTQSNITSVDPKFLGGTTDRKYAPSEGSPAINAAKAMPSASITALQTEVDIFGTPRVADSTELGAIEYVRAEPIKTSVKRVDVTTATVYPNPATNTISMKGIQGNVVVSILNMLGAEVLKTNTTQNINISNLPAGVYTIINSQEGSVSQAKFIKK